MRKAATFNITCLIISGMFLCGTAYLWRGEVRQAIFSENPNQYNNITISEPQASNNETIVPTTTASTSTIVAATTALPNFINLPVPFTSQAPEGNWEQPWQDACEEAALLMLDAYYKDYGLSPFFSRDEMQKMVDWETERGWEYSISIEKIKQMAEEYLDLNKTYRIIEDPTIEQIKNSLAKGNPVYAVADGKILPNPFYSGEGPVYHALIIRGYTDTEFITNDPGTKRGEGFKYKYDDLMNALRDWNGGIVKKGRRIVLVID